MGDGFKGFCGACDQGLDDGLAELFDGRGSGFSGGWGRRAGGLLLRGRGCFCGCLAGFFWGGGFFCWVGTGGDCGWLCWGGFC